MWRLVDGSLCFVVYDYNGKIYGVISDGEMYLDPGNFFPEYKLHPHLSRGLTWWVDELVP